MVDPLLVIILNRMKSIIEVFCPESVGDMFLTITIYNRQYSSFSKGGDGRTLKT